MVRLELIRAQRVEEALEDSIAIVIFLPLINALNPRQPRVSNHRDRSIAICDAKVMRGWLIKPICQVLGLTPGSGATVSGLPQAGWDTPL